MRYLPTLLFAALFLTPVPYLLWVRLPWPPVVYWLAMAAAYAVIHLAVWAVATFSPAIWPNMPEFLRELTRRTGIQGTDRAAFWICLAATGVLLGSQAWLQVPLAVAAAVAFVSLAARPVELQPVGTPRAVVAPPNLPPEAIEADRRPFEERGEAADAVVKEYTWEFDRSVRERYCGRLVLAIDPGRYEHYAARNLCNTAPPMTRQFKEFVTDGTTQEVLDAAAQFIQMSQEEGFSTFLEAMNVLAFSQSLPYALDEETKGREYWRYPVETVMDGTGDCDCKTILAASILQAMGHRVVMLIGPAHAALGLWGADGLPGRFLRYEGHDYYYCETTAEGWRVGEVPEGVPLDQFRAYEV